MHVLGVFILSFSAQRGVGGGVGIAVLLRGNEALPDMALSICIIE